MATKQETFATEQEAIERGEQWEKAWGRAYCPNYTVWKDSKSGQWVCNMTRWDSCD